MRMGIRYKESDGNKWKNMKIVGSVCESTGSSADSWKCGRKKWDKERDWMEYSLHNFLIYRLHSFADIAQDVEYMVN